MKHIKLFEEFLNEFGPLAGSGNPDRLEPYVKQAQKKSENGSTQYVIKTKSGYKLSKYYESGKTIVGYHNGQFVEDDYIRESDIINLTDNF